MEQLQVVFDFLRMVRRRFIIIALISGVGVGTAVFIAYILPAVYQSTARILVEDQQIPGDLARSTVTQTASQRLDIITQKLMSRSNLIKLIEEFNLYADRPDLSMTKKIERLRIEAVLIPITRPPPNHQMLSAFMIQVTMTDPELAARVANEFVTLVLDQNAQVRTRQAEETLAFFEKEVVRISGKISNLEQEIIEYKRGNEDALPENLTFLHDQINQMSGTAQEIDRSIFDLESQRDGLQTELATLRAAAAGSGPTGERPGVRELREIDNELAELRAIYADSHRRIQALLARRAAVSRRLESQASASAPTLNVAQEERQEQLLRRIQQLNAQIDEKRDEKESLAEVEVRIKAAIRRTGDVQVVLSAFERRLTDLQDQLALIQQRRAEAETGERLEVNQQAERFEVVENALVPEFPISPNRKKVAAMGMAASVGLAFGLAFLLEMLFPKIRSAAQMQRQLDLRPVIEIPHIRTRGERRKRLVKGLAIVLLLGVTIPGGLYAVDQKVMPLQRIGEKVVEKTGLSEIIRVIEARF